jgi:ketosteroid isomerase-like protein
VLSLILPLLLSQAAAEAPATAVPTDLPGSHEQEAADPEIKKFFADYFSAVERGHPDAILSLIDGDFVIKWPVGEPITDRERLRAALARLQRAVRQQIQWEVLETRVAGPWAWARVAEKATHSPRAGGSARVLDGSHLVILRKVGGRWMLHRDYGSLNQLPASR